jgi:hypothetical protein
MNIELIYDGKSITKFKVIGKQINLDDNSQIGICRELRIDSTFSVVYDREKKHFKVIHAISSANKYYNKPFELTKLQNVFFTTGNYCTCIENNLIEIIEIK